MYYHSQCLLSRTILTYSCQAWLLWALTKRNKKRGGALYGKGLPEPQQLYLIWQACLRQSYNSAPSRRSRTFTTAISEAVTRPNYPHNGILRVDWPGWLSLSSDNKARYETGPYHEVVGVKRLTLDEFEASVKRYYRLQEANKMIASMIVHTDNMSKSTFITQETWNRVTEEAACTKNSLRVDVVFEDRILPSENSLPPLDGEENTPSRAERFARLLAGRSADSYTPGDSFWMYSLIRHVLCKYDNPIGTDVADHNNDFMELDYEALALAYDPAADEATGPPVPHEFTPEQIERYRELEKWIDNQEFQRQGHKEACERLAIEDPDHPKFEGMNLGMHFKPWQVVAILGLLDIEEAGLYKGGILADQVGLGKTWMAIGVILYVRSSSWKNLAVW